MSFALSNGKPYPLGAHWQGNGTNFALFSAHAEKVELCLYDSDGTHELARVELPRRSNDVWHGFLPDVEPGQLYAYRVHGPYAPHEGHRFNASKIVLDPYARKLHGEFLWSETHFAYDPQSRQQDLTRDIRDNARFLPKCEVVEPLPDFGERGGVAAEETLFYELHVKGFTQQHPDVPVDLRGTFAGLAHESVIAYLKDLGVNSVELLPVQRFIDEPFVRDKGLSNYWGYNSFAFFVPEARYCASAELSEFRDMVRAFHQAGIEVILDVVYNHTAEGNHLGPTFSFKGIDNASYYRLEKEDKRFYVNHSGCGNTLNLHHPRVVQLVTDSLRYWVETMGVDGFRFDLASILGRHSEHFELYSGFFTALGQDPVLAGVKLIAEPWDIGPGGYQLGRFPGHWLEWNDQYRDTVRRFWRGDEAMVPELARRLHGSSDIFEHGGRKPASSINFITSHDGYTLHDLVSYANKHNHANGENNRDGHNGNFSSNYGVEGETRDPDIIALRARQRRNILATLLLSQGTPMLLAGDEFGNSQNGNNNAYCQDNPITWLNWQSDLSRNRELHDFVRGMLALRKAHPLLNRDYYQHGLQHDHQTGLADIAWFNRNGESMIEQDWLDPGLKTFAMLLGDTEDGDEATRVCSVDDGLLVLFNADDRAVEFRLPKLAGRWRAIVDTAIETGIVSPPQLLNSKTFSMASHSCAVITYEHSRKT